MTSTSSEDTSKIAPAFVKAQGEMSNVVKDMDGQAGNQKIKYADLATVLDMAKPILQANGLAVQWRSLDVGSGARVQCVILHESGQWYAEEGMRVPARQENAQQVGSSYTYGKRYTLMGMLGLATEDDDGHAASVEPRSQQQTVRPRSIGDKPLTDAEKGELKELAIASGLSATWANANVKNLDRGQVAAFKAHCAKHKEAN